MTAPTATRFDLRKARRRGKGKLMKRDALLSARVAQIAARSSSSHSAATEIVAPCATARLYIPIGVIVILLALGMVGTQSLSQTTFIFWSISCLGWLPVLVGFARHHIRHWRGELGAKYRQQAPSLPTITIVLPLYQEANMVEQLAQAMAKLDYPSTHLDCMVLLEADDAATSLAATRAAWPSFCRLLSVPKGIPKTKARACNYAMRRAFNDILVVFDAEDQPHRSQLREAARRFARIDEKLACLQAPLQIMPQADSWLQNQFAVEYHLLFQFILPNLDRAAGALPLGGSSNYFRLKTLRQIGGWDDFNLTEDAELGLRLAQNGYRVETLTLPTYENAPHNLPVWYCQRTRWYSGHMQTLHMHVPRLHRHISHLPLTLTNILILLARLTTGPTHMLSLLLVLHRLFDPTLTLAFDLPTLLPLTIYLLMVFITYRLGRASSRRGRLFIAMTHAVYWLLSVPPLLNAAKRMALGQVDWLKSPHTPYERPEENAHLPQKFESQSWSG